MRLRIVLLLLVAALVPLVVFAEEREETPCPGTVPLGPSGEVESRPALSAERTARALAQFREISRQAADLAGMATPLRVCEEVTARADLLRSSAHSARATFVAQPLSLCRSDGTSRPVSAINLT